jgi:hypothetical protein
METRELKDSQGNVIVTVSLPIGTSEEKWAEVLSGYIINEPEDPLME